MKRVIITVMTLIVLTGLLVAQDCYDCGQNNREMKGRMMRQNHQEDNGMMRGHQNRDNLMDELDLNDAQKAKFAELRTENKKSEIELEADIKSLKVDKRDAMKNKDFDQVKKLIKEINDIKEEIQLKKIDFQEAKWNLLDSDQKAKLEELRKESPKMGMKNMKEMKQRRMQSE